MEMFAFRWWLSKGSAELPETTALPDHQALLVHRVPWAREGRQATEGRRGRKEVSGRRDPEASSEKRDRKDLLD